MQQPVSPFVPPDHITLYVLPVSGGLFGVQLGLLSAVAKATAINASAAFTAGATGPLLASSGLRPNLVLGSSGGNIAAYAGAAADWSAARLGVVVDHISTRAFLNVDSALTSSVSNLPYAKGLYRRGYGLAGIFNSMFSEGKLADDATPEIWTGVHHMSSRSHRLVTNKRFGRTILSPASITDNSTLNSLHLGASIHPIYTAGSRDQLAEYSIASASIPFLVESVKIHGDEYRDGGCMYASPLTVLQNDIYDATDGATKKFRSFYFCPVTISNTRTSKSNILQVLDDLVFATRTLDMQAFITLVCRMGAVYESPSVHRRLDVNGLATLLRDLEASATAYAVILYPDIPLEEFISKPITLNLDLMQLNPHDIKGVMARVEEFVGAMVWAAP